MSFGASAIGLFAFLFEAALYHPLGVAAAAGGRTFPPWRALPFRTRRRFSSLASVAGTAAPPDSSKRRAPRANSAMPPRSEVSSGTIKQGRRGQEDGALPHRHEAEEVAGEGDRQRGEAEERRPTDSDDHFPPLVPPAAGPGHR